MDLAAVFLLSLLGGYHFASICYFTAYSTRRVEGHHLYFRAALYGACFFTASLLLRRCLLLNPTYSGFDAALIEYVLPVLKDESGPAHQLEQTHRAEWVVTAMYSLVLGLACALLVNLLTPKKWAARAAQRNMGPLDRLLLHTQQQGVPVLITLDTGKVYIGVVQQITDPKFEPAMVTILPMFSGHRDDLGRMALTTDYEAVYNSLPSGLTRAPPDLTQFYMLIRADNIVSANQFSPVLYARFHPKWRQKMVERNQPQPPQEVVVRLKLWS